MPRLSNQTDELKMEASARHLLRDGWPATGLLRVDQIIGPGRLPISRSQFWVLVREKDLKSVKLSPRVTCFWVHELRRVFFGEEYELRMFIEPAQALATHNTPLAAISNATANPGGRRPVSTIPTTEDF
jgi:hypothetical protein